LRNTRESRPIVLGRIRRHGGTLTGTERGGKRISGERVKKGKNLASSLKEDSKGE